MKEPSPDDQLLLTKGDNNWADDVELYQGLDWLERRHIVGKVRGCVKFRLAQSLLMDREIMTEVSPSLYLYVRLRSFV